MLFSSIPFLFFFLPVTLAVYYVVPRAGKNAVLLFFSLVFYAWGEPAFVLLMILSIVVNWWLGLRLEHARGTDHAKRARTWLVVAVIFNIGLLGFFKYADFIAGNIAALTGADISMPGLPLPIGISFYTFQILSYVIDLYWGRVWVQTNIIDLGTYVALFPQLIAGPIVRIRDVAVALRERQETFAMFAEGISRFVT
ncbi:MAG TPA: MBOAT family protein, partial [Clostridiaceae bacterium]|nr:MBOAT family protein [Clostridiaceae bacterium]